MTDLQTSLIVIGGVIVGGVISFNKWQEWRAKKSVDSAFSPLGVDILMGQGDTPVPRQEPHFDASPVEAAAAPDTKASSATEPEADFTEDADDAIAAASAEAAGHACDVHANADANAAEQDEPATQPVAFIEAVAKPSPLDPVIDCIIPLSLQQVPLRGERISAAFHGLRLVGNKPVQILGQTSEGQWESVAHGGAYHALQLGVQLATRSSALTELEYSELVTRLNQIADDLGADPELPDMQQVMAQAHRLQQMVLEFDAQLSVNVQTNGAPWLASTLRAALQRQGLELRPDGRLVMPDGEGGILFALQTNANQGDDTTTLMTLLLPVPSIAPQRHGFNTMTTFAKSLASRLSGRVVDDSGQPLNDAALAEISAQVDAFYDAMEQAGLRAGSTRALRLFA